MSAGSTTAQVHEALQGFERIQAALKQQRTALEAANAALDLELRLLQETLQEHLEDNRAQQQIHALESELAQLGEALKEQRSQREQLERKLHAEEETRQQERERLQELQEDLNERSAAADAARVRVAALETQLAEKEHNAGQWSAQREALEAKLTALEAETASEKNAAQEALNELETLRNTLDAANSARDAALARATELEAAHTADSALQEKLDAALAQAAQAETLRAEATAGQQLLQTERESLRDALQEQEAASERLRQALAGAESENKSLRESLSAGPTQEAVDALREELRQAREKIQVLEDKLQAENARGTKAVIASQLAEALKEAETANEEVRQLRRQLLDQQKHTGAPRPSETERIKAVIARQSNGAKRSLGELLQEAEILSQEQINECLEYQKKNPHQHIGAILIERRLVSEEGVAHALAYQCGARYVSLEEASISGEATALLNGRLAQKHQCVPLATNEDTLTLAMANPADLVAIEDIERATGKKVEVVVSTETAIKAALEKHY